MITASPGGFKGLDYAMKTIAVGLEVVGVAIIVLGALVTFGVFLKRLRKEGGLEEWVHQFRRDLGLTITVVRAGDCLRLAGCGSFVECNLGKAHSVHRTHQSDFTLVDHLSQHHAPVAELLHGELHVHFRDGLDKLIVLRGSG